MNVKTNEFLGRTRALGVLILAALLASCGGGSGGSTSGGGNTPPTSPLSNDQKIFEAAELNGSTSGINYLTPYGGGNLVSGVDYFYASSTNGLSKSPSVAGPQLETPAYTSLDSALAIPTLGVTRFLVGNQVLVRSSTAMRQISYVGSGVQYNLLADDGSTVVESVQYSNFSNVPLSGTMENTPEEFLAIYRIDELIKANNFSANAKWQSGAAYLKRQSALVNDTYIAQDCTISSSVTTTSSSTTPCQTGVTLDNFFPVTIYNGHPQETDFATDGTIGIVNGVRMWVANQPLPPADDTTVYRVFYELNGNVYQGLLEKAGTPFLFSQSDGSVVSYSLIMNQAAVNSIQQGLITGASVPGSEVGSTTEVPTFDLFGIGGHGINGALAPIDLQTHYVIPATLTGAGQTIVIVDAPSSGDIADDLNVFSQSNNLPQCNSNNPCFQHIDLSNGAPIAAGHDWGAEPELDTQMVHAIAPGARIILVTANSDSQSDIFAAINTAAGMPGVTAVTMSFSYGGAPSDFQNEDNFLSGFQANQGIALFASSGDDGNSPFGTSYPASSPFVTAVGGTRINSVTWNPSVQSEVAWQFSGGGQSAYAPMPAWQLSYLGATAQSINMGERAVPDVAAVADAQHSAIAIYYKERWVMSGGTSASSPIWTGISALMAQQLTNEGRSLATLVKTTPGGFNGLLYQTKVTQGVNTGFYDILSGSNNLSSTPCSYCSAGPGYDEVTGWGAPNVGKLLSNF